MRTFCSKEVRSALGYLQLEFNLAFSGLAYRIVVEEARITSEHDEVK